MTRILGLIALAGLLGMSSGCRNCCNRQQCAPAPPPPRGAVFVAPPPPSGVVVPPPPGAVVAPAAAFPTAPPPPPPPPPVGGPSPGPGGPPPSITPLPPGGAPQSRYEPQLKQTDARAPMVEAEKPRVQLYAPESIDKDSPKASEEPSASKKPGALTTLPPIPQFAIAKDNVYAGLSPKGDGLDWLQAKGVKTIVHIRLAGSGESGDRELVEKRKLQYVPFFVSPQTLTKDKVEEFVKLIRDGAAQGIFIYDEDGALAGAMWYLHLRHGEILDDDAAQLRARPLGLQTDRDGMHGEMWRAAKKLVTEQ